MKSCVIGGNLASDKIQEQYPTVNYCEDCFELLSCDDENTESFIVHETAFDICHGKTCENCDCELEV